MEWQVTITITAALATFIGLSLQVRHSRLVQRQELREEVRSTVASLTSQIGERIKERHERETQVLHKRISELREKYDERLGKLETIEGTLMEQGRQVRVIYNALIDRKGST